MRGKLAEALRGVARMAERLVSVLPMARLPEEVRSNAYPAWGPTPGGLAEPGPVGFSDIAPVPGVAEADNPAMMLATADHNGLPQANVLEALLYIVGSKAECRKTAELALEAFGSVGAVLAARVPDLTAKLGVHDQVAYALKAIHAGMRSVLREPIRERLMVGSSTELIDYLGLSLKHESIEVLRALYLDRKNGLISDEEVYHGTVDHVPLYPREIVKRALELGASAVIIVHNHPSGDSKPSTADVRYSQELQRALSVMGIAMHDSIIVGRHGHTSLGSLGCLR